MKTYGILCFVLALFMILTPLLSLDYSSFSLSNVKSTFQKENDSEDEEKLLDEKSDSVKIKSAASGNVATASTKEYIIGCVAAEMPAESFFAGLANFFIFHAIKPHFHALQG